MKLNSSFNNPQYFSRILFNHNNKIYLIFRFFNLIMRKKKYFIEIILWILSQWSLHLLQVPKYYQITLMEWEISYRILMLNILLQTYNICRILQALTRDHLFQKIKMIFLFQIIDDRWWIFNLFFRSNKIFI